jgi:predicted transcriptional regulator
MSRTPSSRTRMACGALMRSCALAWEQWRGDTLDAAVADLGEGLGAEFGARMS